MIPVRKGSKRVPKKALRKIGDISLLEQAIELSLSFFSANDVYLNTDWIELKTFCNKYKINFYRREQKLSSDISTNDDFMSDFLKNVSCDRVVQLLPTSPYLSSKEFKKFTQIAKDIENRTLISVSKHQIACVKEDGKPINFSRNHPNPPSQQMKSVFSYATVLMSWNTEKFINDFSEKGHAYHGDEKNIYFPLEFISQLDIDNEDDMKQAIKLQPILPKHRF